MLQILEAVIYNRGVAKSPPSETERINTDLLASQLSPLRDLIESRKLTELMINPDGSVWIEKSGRLCPTTRSLSPASDFR